jgi:hypothetical protein
MEQHILKFAIEYRGRHKKVWQFLMPLKSAYNKKLCQNNRSVFLKTAETWKQWMNLINDIFLEFKMSSIYLFRAALCELMFVLEKDALIHCHHRQKFLDIYATNSGVGTGLSCHNYYFYGKLDYG